MLMSRQGKEKAAAALRQQQPHATMGEATHAGVKICEIYGSQATLATAALARVLLTRGASSPSASDSSPGAKEVTRHIVRVHAMLWPYAGVLLAYPMSLGMARLLCGWQVHIRKRTEYLRGAVSALLGHLLSLGLA